ncbi:helix-turn-helix transcriptional regulator [Mesorhizobium opportunistum]|uniref:Helix-turn-helix transcriptional regulator n=1 Tax=Mesorhizobium opportunistum TaxID=593909 RepID=A0ABV1YD31_9HYPH|nr:helix-turn-helix transcriptional regulator [Mesorhizobium sp.]TIN97981.1 MAG: helix-turn-helix transcriptional regulator [Mesorhizobium sp.]TJV01179.1 MAG: helix-turn-helix transcriptional regulator [Mesorhizobium sp.]TJV19791.1 MAG: helix-turn-helix transcriptional regulator [Mesorhizobium sp.]
MPKNAKSHALSEPLASEIGQDYSALKAMRETRGYSLEELSLTCGLSVDEIEDIENGRAADPAKLRRIASALRLPQDTLIASAASTPAAHGRPLA